MDTLTTADLLPEFERLPGLVHRRHYVIARRPRGNDGHLQVTLTHPQYDAEADSWLFPDGHSRRRDSEDLWIPVDELPGAERRAWERHQLRTADESDARTRPTEPSLINRLLDAPLPVPLSRIFGWLIVAVSLAIFALVSVMAVKGFSLGEVLLACTPLIIIKAILVLFHTVAKVTQ